MPGGWVPARVMDRVNEVMQLHVGAFHNKAITLRIRDWGHPLAISEAKVQVSVIDLRRVRVTMPVKAMGDPATMIPPRRTQGLQWSDELLGVFGYCKAWKDQQARCLEVTALVNEVGLGNKFSPLIFGTDPTTDGVILANKPWCHLREGVLLKQVLDASEIELT